MHLLRPYRKQKLKVIPVLHHLAYHLSGCSKLLLCLATLNVTLPCYPHCFVFQITTLQCCYSMTRYCLIKVVLYIVTLQYYHSASIIYKLFLPVIHCFLYLLLLVISPPHGCQYPKTAKTTSLNQQTQFHLNNKHNFS